MMIADLLDLILAEQERAIAFLTVSSPTHWSSSPLERNTFLARAKPLSRADARAGVDELSLVLSDLAPNPQRLKERVMMQLEIF